MISFKYLVFGILGLYIFGFATVLIYENRSVEQIQTLRGLHSTNVNFHQTPYKFTNPALAYAVLSQLEHIEEFNVRTGFNNKTEARPYMSLKKDDHYCDKRRAFFVQFPETVFKEITFVNDLGPKTLMRNKVLTPIGTDVQPYLKGHMPKEDQTLYDIDPSVNNFFTRMALYTSNKIGQHYSCLSQVSSHLPGKQVLDKKDDLAEAVIEYGGRFEERPQCFNNNKFFPKTFLLYKKEDCKEFFKVFNSPQYLEAKKEKKIVYMKKIGRGAHMGAGVDPVTDKIEAELKKTYDNGKKCGKVNSKVLIQNFIHNPLLLNGRKFDFRMYMFVASSNPLIAFYHDGFLRVSLVPYDVDSNDKKSLLTNLALSNQIYDDAKTGNLFEGMSIEEMKHAQQWNFERLQEYLLSTGVITDPNWLDNYLRPEFKKAMIHLLRFGLVSPFEHSSVYQLYGIDFMLDADLNLWFIEANSAPGLGGYSQVLDKQIVKMLKDEVEIAMGLLRSRMKRVINYVNELIESGSVIENEQGEVVIKHFETNKAMFDKIAQNYFEEEFKPSEENGFSKIIDGNYKGAEKYLGFISEECL